MKFDETRLVEQLYPTTGSSSHQDTEYYVRSSVLGGAVLTELKENGDKLATKVYAGNTVVAEQRTEGSDHVVWHHKDPLTQSFTTTSKTGVGYEADEPEFNAEFEPLGAVLPQEDPAFDDIDPMPVQYRKRGGGNPFEPEVGCIVNHIWEEYCNEGRAHLMAHYSGTIGGAFISFERYVDDTTVSLPCGEDDGPDCVPIGPDVSNPRITYGVTITRLPFAPPGLTQVSVWDCSNDGAVSAFPFVNSAILGDFNAAIKAVNDAIGQIGFTEMFRTTDHQKVIKAKADKKQEEWEKSWTPSVMGLNPKPYPAASPGTSSHEAGFSFDIPNALLNGKRGERLISILAENGFVRDIMKHPTFGDDPIHFTHNSWGKMTEEEQRQSIAEAQAAFTKLGLPKLPGAVNMSAPRVSRTECN